MKDLNYYIELCKVKKGFSKDVELADFLRITKSSLSHMKAGGGASQETAELIAKGAGVALETVWFTVLYEREKNPRFKKVMENISKMAGIAASFLFAIQWLTVNFLAGIGAECILCKIVPGYKRACLIV